MSYYDLPLPNDKKALLFVNYHHVKERAPDGFPKLHYVTPEKFRAQIAMLGRIFDFPQPEAVRNQILSGVGFDNHCCVLTFDDGLRDHFESVQPILDELGISGVFSVNTAPWSTNRMLSVHMAHLLSAAFSYLDLADDIETAARLHGIAQSISEVDPQVAKSQYRYDDASTACVKYFLNAVIPQNYRAVVLSDVFMKRLGENERFVGEHYLTPRQARLMVEAGHTLAMHTHTHLHLASASKQVRNEDIHANLSALRQYVLGNEAAINWVSYPYGSPTSYDDFVIQEFRQLGCDMGLTMRRGLNNVNSMVHPMKLARVDTNDVIGGKAPIKWDELVYDFN